MPLSVVPREKWGAVPPRYRKDLEIPAKYVFTTLTYGRPSLGTKACAVELQRMQQIDVRSAIKAPDIRYNFVVSKNGQVYECRGWTDRPTVPKTFGRLNSESVFIGLLGTFNDVPIPDSMFEARREIIKFGLDNFLIRKQYFEIFLHMHKKNFVPYLGYQIRRHELHW